MRRTVKNNHEHLSKYVVTVEFSTWKFPINWWLLSHKNQQKASFHNMPLTLSWSVWARTSDSRWGLPHLAKNEPRTFRRTWRSWRCAHTVVLLNKYTCLSAEFLWVYSHHQPMEIITLGSIGWLGIFKEKIQRWKCIWKNVRNFYQLFSITIQWQIISI